MTGIATGLTASPLPAERAVLDVIVGAGDGFLGRVPAGGRFQVGTKTTNAAAASTPAPAITVIVFTAWAPFQR